MAKSNSFFLLEESEIPILHLLWSKLANWQLKQLRNPANNTYQSVYKKAVGGWVVTSYGLCKINKTIFKEAVLFMFIFKSPLLHVWASNQFIYFILIFFLTTFAIYTVVTTTLLWMLCWGEELAGKPGTTMPRHIRPHFLYQNLQKTTVTWGACCAISAFKNCSPQVGYCKHHVLLMKRFFC